MPTFIKTGYWESAVKSYKGWLNLEELISSSGAVFGTGTAGQLAFWGTSGISGSDNLYWNNTSGRLGIGLTTPLVKLHVYDNSVGDTVYVENNGGVPSIQTYYRNNNVNPTSGGNVGALLFASYFNSTYAPPAQEIAGIFGVYLGSGTNRVGGLDFRTHDGSGLQLRIRVNNLGNVMIGGSVDGGEKLQVNGTARVTGTSAFNNSLTNTIGGFIHSSVSSTNDAFYTSQSSNIRFYVNSGGYCKSTSSIVTDTNGTPSLNASAIAQIDSTTKGFLPPRMTTAQRTGISLPAAGLVVYDITDNRHYGYNGTTWNAFY